MGGGREEKAANQRDLMEFLMGKLTAMAKSWACAISESLIDEHIPPIEIGQGSTAASETDPCVQWCCLAPRYPPPPGLLEPFSNDFSAPPPLMVYPR